MPRPNHDPTDAHAPAIPQPGKLELLDALPTLQALHGICSEPSCQWPIAGWCEADATGGCRAKLCYDHLAEHRNRHQHDAAMAALAGVRISPESWANAIEREAGAVDWPDDDDETEELAAQSDCVHEWSGSIAPKSVTPSVVCVWCGATQPRLARPDAPGRE